jgi:hypothetical protein
VTATGIGEIMVGVGALGSLVVGLRNRKTVQEIHVLVNAKMTDALDKIAALERLLEEQNK